MHILALDVGTSCVKAAVLDVATAEPVGSHRPRGVRPGPADAGCRRSPRRAPLVRRDRRRPPSDVRGAGHVEGIGLSSMTPALVLLDEADRPLAPIWTHLDRRSRQAVRQTWAAVGEEFLATTGNRPLPGGISGLCYRQQVSEDPYLFRRARSYLHVNGWLGLRLTGERRSTAATPVSAACSAR